MEGRVNLTSVQGVGLLYHKYACTLSTDIYIFLLKTDNCFSMCLMGKDRVGLNYMSQSCLSIRELVSGSDEFIAAASSQADDMARSIEICVRGLFSFLSYVLRKYIQLQSVLFHFLILLDWRALLCKHRFQ